MSFYDVLISHNIEPDKYLNIAKKYAIKHGYNPNLLKFSIKNNYKLNYDGVDFGHAFYNDYIIYKMLDNNEAEEIRINYLKRSGKIKGYWKKNILSKNNLARSILWDA